MIIIVIIIVIIVRIRITIIIVVVIKVRKIRIVIVVKTNDSHNTNLCAQSGAVPSQHVSRYPFEQRTLEAAGKHATS